MARLTRAPFLAARASKPANPAISRRAPSQSAASRTTLCAGSKAPQHTQLARNAPAASARTNSSAYRALGNNSDKNGSATDYEQKKYASKQQTRIPAPEISKTIAKWAEMRKYHAITYQVYVKKKSKYEDDGDLSLMPDTNPDLLHDESFDETRDPYKQSSMEAILSRFQALKNVLKRPMGVTGRYPGVLIPSYGGGNHFKLGRKRPRPVPAPRIVRGIAQKLGTTLKYKKIDHAPAPTVKILEQVKFEKQFGFGFKPRDEPKSEQDFSSEPKLSDSEATVLGVTDSSDNELRTDSGVDVPSKTTSTNSSEPISKGKTVSFAADAVEPFLYHREAYAKDVKNLFEIGDDWTPIKRNCTYSSSTQSTGFDTMFIHIGNGSISLKRRVAIRFKAVQEYEKRRRQNSIDAGGHPALGQLDYGNADYRIAMQVSNIITAHDIGTIVEPGKLDMPASRGPLLHFGDFAKDMGCSFEDTLIPTSTAAAYKKPIQWLKAPKDQDALDKWVASSFPALQPAKLVEYDEGDD